MAAEQRDQYDAEKDGPQSNRQGQKKITGGEPRPSALSQRQGAGFSLKNQEQYCYKALGLSVLLHLVLFIAVALSGFFLLLKPQHTEPNVQVVVYEDDTPGDGSTGGGSSPAVPPAPAADAIVIPDKTVLPEIHEEYTKEPAKQ